MRSSHHPETCRLRTLDIADTLPPIKNKNMKSFPKLTITLLLLIIAISGYSQSLIKPESVGLSTERLEILNHVLDEYVENKEVAGGVALICLLYTSPSPRDRTRSRMPSSA